MSNGSGLKHSSVRTMTAGFGKQQAQAITAATGKTASVTTRTVSRGKSRTSSQSQTDCSSATYTEAAPERASTQGTCSRAQDRKSSKTGWVRKSTRAAEYEASIGARTTSGGWRASSFVGKPSAQAASTVSPRLTLLCAQSAENSIRTTTPKARAMVVGFAAVSLAGARAPNSPRTGRGVPPLPNAKRDGIPAKQETMLPLFLLALASDSTSQGGDPRCFRNNLGPHPTPLD